MKDIISPDQNSYNLASYVSVEASELPIEERVNQQNLLPTAITNRFLSDAVSNSAFSQIPFTVTNNTSTTASCILVDKDDRVILALPQISVFIGINDYLQATALNQWPNSSVGGGNFPVYFNPFDFFQVQGNQQVARVTCRNNSGSDQQVLLVVRWKLLTVPTTTPNNTASAAT